MSALELLQQRQLPVAPPKPAGGLIVETSLRGVSLNRRGELAKSSPADFDVNIEFGETTRSQKGRFNLKYSISIRNAPSTQEARLHGEAVVDVPWAETDDILLETDAVMNTLATEIFKKDYETIYLLYASLGLEAPAPSLTENVHLVC